MGLRYKDASGAVSNLVMPGIQAVKFKNSLGVVETIWLKAPPPPVGQLLMAIPYGALIKFKVNNVDRKFRIIQQGKPASALYDNAGWDNITLVMMEDIYEKRAGHSSQINDYSITTMHAHLNGAFLDLIEEKVRNIIPQIRIPYRTGNSGSAINSGANGLLTKGFLLGGYEVGYTTATYSTLNIDGIRLSYFLDGTSTAASDKRIAKLSGVASDWQLRTALGTSDNGAVAYLNSTGVLTLGGFTTARGLRPALPLPNNTLVSLEPDVDGAYTVVGYQDEILMSDLPVGGTVKFNINNVEKQVIKVQNGKPASVLYDNAGWDDISLVLLKDIYENRAWHSSNVNDYANSTIHAHLNGAFLDLIENKVRNIIPQIRIPFCWVVARSVAAQLQIYLQTV